MNSTQKVISSASPARTPANELLPVQQQQADTKESLYQLPIQRKLSVGAADDPLEKEADDMAGKVMRMAIPEPINFSTSKTINRKCSECEKEEELQRKESNSETVLTAPSIVQDVLRTPGRSLDTDTRSFMEPRFNYDFNDVKIHDNDFAAKSASSINALAYTSGNNIVFNSGQYNTNSDSGKRLLAHELTHTIQQKTNASIQPMIQRFDIAPTVPGAVERTLTPAEIKKAISWNQAAFPDADEVSLLREVLEISAEPAVIDEDFIKALVQYQANFGLTQDGLLGAGTALRLSNELKAKATAAGPAADVGSGTKMALNPAQRREKLRSTVVGRLGRMLHQGFIGPADNPTGVVTVRSGFNDPNVAVPGPRDNNTIGINYTGNNVANSRWLQFAFRQMSAIDPTTGRRIYRPGNVATTGGLARPYSDGTTFRWTVDTVPATGSMYYEAGAGNERDAAHTEIFDQPAGWNGEADAFAGTFATRPNNVRMINGFDTFLVVNNNSVVYHVRWNVYFNFNTSVTPTTDVAGTYEALTAGAVSRLPTDRKAALDAAFPTNTVP